MRNLAIVLAFCLSACGGSSSNATSAYSAALHVAKRVCAVIDTLPDAPPPVAGGEAPPAQ
jgi:hypothetical protein